jgi:hypothetical protein
MVGLIFLGWVVGLVVAGVTSAGVLTAFGLVVPALLVPLGAFVAAFLAALPLIVTAILAMALLVVAYIVAYLIATSAIAPLLTPLVSGPITFPATAPFTTASGAATTVPPSGGEFFARGMVVGLTAATNFILLNAVPIVGPVLAAWAFLIVSLGAIVFVARNPFYQGFLGWSAWLFPLSWVATVVGLALFILNIPFAFGAGGIGAFRIDWTTGVIETAGGLPTPFFSGGFSLGNFNFMTVPVTGFGLPGTSAHETGHSLNTAVGGGIVLWINAVDENVFPARWNLAYGELLAEGHSRAMPPPPPATADFSIRIWF